MQSVAKITKIVFSLLLIAYLWKIFGPSNILSILSNAKLKYLGFGLSFLLLGQFASGVRHARILSILNVNLSMAHVIDIALLGTLLNQILPTGMGGDVYRVIRISEACSWESALASVILDRILGLLFKLSLIFCFFPIYLFMQIPLTVKLLIFLFSIIPLLFICFFLWLPSIYAYRNRIPAIISKWLEIIHDNSFHLNINNLKILIFPLIGGLFPYLICYACICISLGAYIHWTAYIYIIPLIFLAMQFPLSFGGWGIREGAAIYLFSTVGMDQGIALVSSSLFGLSLIATSLIGVLIMKISSISNYVLDVMCRRT